MWLTPCSSSSSRTAFDSEGVAPLSATAPTRSASSCAPSDRTGSSGWSSNRAYAAGRASMRAGAYEASVGVERADSRARARDHARGGWSSFPVSGAAARAVVRARFLPWASRERLGALIGTAAVATCSCRWRPPFEKLSFSRAEVGRTRGQFVLDGRAASTVVITGTRRGLDCSGFLTWTSSAPLA